jgi:putative (di)nucleoside polyphosphate hydrolase
MLNYLPMATRFFRAGVGTVIYNDNQEIAIFRRSQPPIGIWELPQGGIDLGEAFEMTLWRELQEEIGLVPENIETVTEMPGWTSYQSLSSLTDTSIDSLGQTHHWYFLKLKNDCLINLASALQDEASEFRWTDFDELISLTREGKKHVYVTLRDYFKNEILT